MNQTAGEGKEKVCNCRHHKVVPIAVIIVGIVVLLGAFSYFDFRTESIILGLLAVFIGFTKLFERNCGCC